MLCRDTSSRRWQPKHRCLDIEKSDTGGLALGSPITMVPTAVLMKGGREVDRIAGYWGPDNFLRMVTFIMGRAE